MKGKTTLIIAVLEALVLLTIKLSDWAEARKNKPRAATVRRANKHRVVQPGSAEYDGESPEETTNAAYLPASGSTTDEKIY